MASWQSEILRAYREILGREPEPGAVAWWEGVIAAGNDGINTVADLRRHFRESAEAESIRAGQIHAAYREVLGRDADPSGLATYSAALRDGTYDNLEQLKQALRLSPEAAARGTDSQRSARTIINDQLANWGLESLSDWAWEQIKGGNAEQIPILIRDTEQYKTRFSGLEMRRAKGLNVMSEAQYLQMENDYRTLLSRYGIPSGIFDTQAYLGSLIGNDVAPGELNDRLRIYQDAALNAPAETRAALRRLYNVDEGGLTAYFIDPEHALPILESQYSAAQVASAAERAGFATFGAQVAERLVQLGATGQDTRAFEILDQSRELFTSLGFSEGGSQAEFDEGQAAIGAFGGNATVARTMRRRAEGRVAEFAGGGGFAQDAGGVSGLGSASS